MSIPWDVIEAERDPARRGKLMLDHGLCALDADGHLVLGEHYVGWLAECEVSLQDGVPVFGHIAGFAECWHRPEVIGEVLGHAEFEATLRDTEAAMRRAGLL